MDKEVPRKSQRHRRPKAKLLGIALAAVLIAALLVVSLLSGLSKSQRVDRQGYQVVYMSTGQAYFGKLRNTTGDYLVLETPYTAQNAQTEQSQEAQDTSGRTTLLKVSQQTYGPEDVMSLKADQVLFWQNLRGDSKISQAIDNAK